MNIYFSSDFHGFHQNLVRGCSQWPDKKACRDFDTLEEHNEVLVRNINRKVSRDSILYFLGDWSFQGIDNIWKFRRMLNVEKIHFVGGNHDHHVRRNRIILTDKGYTNAQNLFTSYHELLEHKIGGHTMILCHYPLLTWHGENKGHIHLHGHCHGTLGTYHPRAIDVGIDCNPNFEPFSLQEILDIIEKRKQIL